MGIKNTSTTYGSIAKFFHWVVFLLVLSLLLIGYFMWEYQENKPLFGQIINIHKLIGLTVLILIILRAAWALNNPKPKLPLNTPRWEIFAEWSMHFLLYAVLIAMPLSGWIMSVSSGHSPHLFGWEISLPIEKNEAVSDIFMSIHNTLAIVIIVLVSLHVLAALYHFFVKKDDVLTRMMP